MTRQPFDRMLLPEVLDDLRELADVDYALVDVALRVIVDVARRRKVGKLLGERGVSGNLIGCRRLRFDVPGVMPQRFRVVYQLLPNDENPEIVEVIAVGRRGGHLAYQAAVARMGP